MFRQISFSPVYRNSGGAKADLTSPYRLCPPSLGLVRKAVLFLAFSLPTFHKSLYNKG